MYLSETKIHVEKQVPNSESENECSIILERLATRRLAIIFERLTCTLVKVRRDVMVTHKKIFPLNITPCDRASNEVSELFAPWWPPEEKQCQHSHGTTPANVLSVLTFSDGRKR